MKAVVGAALVLLASNAGIAQKKDSGIPRSTRPAMSGKSFSNKSLSNKSVTSDTVAAVLKNRSTSASDLANIERGRTTHSFARTRTRVPAANGKNLPVLQTQAANASRQGKHAGKHIPTVRKRTTKVG